MLASMRTPSPLGCSGLMIALAALRDEIIQAQAHQLDFIALPTKTRPAIPLLVARDSAENEVTTGTGFLVSADGELVTNYHLIDDGSGPLVKRENTPFFAVKGLLASHPNIDLAVLTHIKDYEYEENVHTI